MLAAQAGGAVHIPFIPQKILPQGGKIHEKRRRILPDPAGGGGRLHLQTDALVIAQGKMGLRLRAVESVAAADGHVARLQKDVISQGKTGLKAPVDAEIQLQQPRLPAQLRVGLHFQPHQHGRHAVQQGKAANFSAALGIFKAAGLPRRAGKGGCALIICDMDHGGTS